MAAVHPHSWRAKAEACARLWARFSFWPLFLAHELVLLPRRFVLDEPAWESDLHQMEAPAAPGGLRSLPLLRTHLQPAMDAVLQPSGTVILRRFQHSWRRSWLMAYNSVVFYAAVAALELLGLDRLVAAFKPEITRLAAALSGLFWGAADVTPGIPVSLINVADPDFSVPYDAAAFPFGVHNTSSCSNSISSGGDEAAAVGAGSAEGSARAPSAKRSHADDSISTRQNGSDVSAPCHGSCQQNGAIDSAVDTSSAPVCCGRCQESRNAAGGMKQCRCSAPQRSRGGGALGKWDSTPAEDTDAMQQNGGHVSAASRPSAASRDSSGGIGAGTGAGIGIGNGSDGGMSLCDGNSGAVHPGALHGRLASGCGLSLGDAHLLAAAAKLVYEEPARILAVAQRWRLQFRAWRSVPAHAAGATGYVPDVIWAALQTEGGVIVAFRGADPFTQVSRRADVPTTLAARPGMGNVLLGFYRAFFHQCEPAAAPQTLSSSPSGRFAAAAAAGGPRCEYDVLKRQLQGLVTDGRRLYITGHSIGGGLAAMFAQALHARGSPLAAEISGIATFGQPRWGDAKAAELFDSRFGDRCLRFTHAGDMVPEIPTAFAGYQHQGARVHIASEALGRAAAARLVSEADEPEALAAVVRVEDCGAPRLGLRRLAKAIAAGNVPLAATRAATLLLPGIGDHFPWDYERALRDALMQP